MADKVTNKGIIEVVGGGSILVQLVVPEGKDTPIRVRLQGGGALTEAATRKLIGKLHDALGDIEKDRDYRMEDLTPAPPANVKCRIIGPRRSYQLDAERMDWLGIDIELSDLPALGEHIIVNGGSVYRVKDRTWFVQTVDEQGNPSDVMFDGDLRAKAVQELVHIGVDDKDDSIEARVRVLAAQRDKLESTLNHIGLLAGLVKGGSLDKASAMDAIVALMGSES